MDSLTVPHKNATNKATQIRMTRHSETDSFNRNTHKYNTTWNKVVV